MNIRTRFSSLFARREVAIVAPIDAPSGYYPWPLGMNGCNDQNPYLYEHVMLWRNGWDAPMFATVADMNPMMNVAGLYWVPAADSSPIERGRVNIDLGEPE